MIWSYFYQVRIYVYFNTILLTCSAVRPLNVFAALTLTPNRISISTRSLFPVKTALHSGVMPFGPGISINLTLLDKIRFNTYSWDFRMALCTDTVFGIVGNVFAFTAMEKK